MWYRVGRNQLCRSDVGRLHGSGQSTGGYQRRYRHPASSIQPFIRSVWARVMPRTFHDITSGNNGFPAVAGYDLEHGLGQSERRWTDQRSNRTGRTVLYSDCQSKLTPRSRPAPKAPARSRSFRQVGFTGSVTLNATGLPSGVTAGFSPNPTSTTSTLTLTVASGTAAGTSTITIGGTSGSLTASTSIQLTITASGPVVP